METLYVVFDPQVLEEAGCEESPGSQVFLVGREYISPSSTTNVKGFHLFAVLVGGLMVLIAVGFAVYVGQEKAAKVDAMAAKITQYEIARLADVVREDAYNTTLSGLRGSLQDYFATNPLYPPDDAWESEQKFKEWFENDFARSEQFLKWIARALASELTAYRYVRKYADYTVSVELEEEETVKTLSKAVRLKILDDGTFTFILDTRNLTEEELRGLPSIKVCQGVSCTTFVVFPSGIWSFPVPLRIMEAYRRAREAYFSEKSHINDFKLALGFCKRTGECALWKCSGFDFRPLYPEEYKGFVSKHLPDVLQPPVGIKYITAPCTSQFLILQGELQKEVNKITGCGEECYLPCDDPQSLYILLQAKLEEYAPEDVNVTLDPVSIKEYKTFHVLSQDAFEIMEAIKENTMLFFLPPGLLGEAGTLPLSSCKDEGYVYCYAPVFISYVVSWQDPDATYRVRNYPAVFLFRQTLKGFETMDRKLSELEKKAEEYEFKPPENQQLDEEWNTIQCVKNGAAQCYQLFERAILACYGQELNGDVVGFCRERLLEGNMPEACKIVLLHSAVEGATWFENLNDALRSWILDQLGFGQQYREAKDLTEAQKNAYFYNLAKEAIATLPDGGDECNRLKSLFLCSGETCKYAYCADLNAACHMFGFEEGIPGKCAAVGNDATIYALRYIHIWELLTSVCSAEYKYQSTE